MKKKINHLDLFSGIGGFHMGFQRAGFTINSFFSEIDKHSIAVYKHQFKNSTYVGSVTDVRGADLPRIDLITFGSPCQDFSLAGKRAGMGGDRSSLILEAIRLIRECRPRVFVWENVKGTFSSNSGEDFASILQEFTNIGGYTIEWGLLNTSWFLPQNRERIYLVGYLAETKRSWRGVFPITTNNRQINELQGQRVPANTILQRYTATANGTYIGERELPAQVKQVGTKLDSNGGTQPYQQDRVYDADGIVPALNQGKSDLILRIKSAVAKGYEEAVIGDSVSTLHPSSETRRGRVGNQKAQTLDTGCSQVVIEPNYTYEKVNETIRRNEFNEGEVKAMDLYNKTLRDVSPALTQPEHNGISLFDGYRIRRLTPIECERLQGFPDNHTAFGDYDGEVKPVSNTQRYKQCGNAVTVDVVEAVANRLKDLF
jgi:DNA (cytosine-5)-methyltransferase 1